MTDACGNYKTNYTADVINLKAFLVSNRNKIQIFFVCFLRTPNGIWTTAAEFQCPSLDSLLCKWVTSIGHVRSKRNSAFY